MWVSVCANVCVSSAARRSTREALQISIRAGGFSSLVVVGITVIGIAILYSTFYVCLGVDTPGAMKVTDLPLLLVGYGFRASFVALFAQLGVGVDRAADAGADLVGKVEQGIPEDDPHNPVVIADLVLESVEVELIAENEILVLEFKEYLPIGVGVLNIEFEGILNNKMKRFYRSILTDGKPHLGTDRLIPLLRNFRGCLQELGVNIKFGTRVDDLLMKD